MTYAMPTVLGHTFTAREWADLNALRLQAFAGERRKRARALSRSVYARLGTDHPALLARELAHGMATSKADTARTSRTMHEWCTRRGKEVEAARCALHAAQDLAECKRWAVLYCQLQARAKRVIVSALHSRIAHLLAEANAEKLPHTVEVLPPTEPRTVALASHLSAQAPPTHRATALNAVSARPFTLLKGVKN